MSRRTELLKGETTRVSNMVYYTRARSSLRYDIICQKDLMLRDRRSRQVDGSIHPEVTELLKSFPILPMSDSLQDDKESSIFGTDSPDSCSDILWSDLEDLEAYMAEVPSKPTCTPQLYDSQSLGKGFKPKKWYLVFTGAGAGCYTTWADVSGRVIGVKGMRYESYASYGAAEHAWRQNCLSKHQHPADFVDGTVFVPPTPLPPPRATTPPADEPDFTYTGTNTTLPAPPPASPPRASTSTSTPRTPVTPSGQRIARAFFDGSSPARQTIVPESRRRWAIVANGITGVFDADAGDAVLEEARLRAIPVQAREVQSLVEATEWLERLDLATDAGSEQ
ncbi:hypothetical protein K435DRAFT_861793 [Dendrothele bispora CBS 962.96]|uniref:Ribonuclease H1 N-terminal domain-containing protein n=1 Tax=Dendrothele bispora (strain CBS 962.96) TaxID=1314807 RepID=A0A4S8LU83_DENBC|nr:hypothetical protein K435DRAFT_861793 [Dendrothele bispora CBS 962.96]